MGMFDWQTVFSATPFGAQMLSGQQNQQQNQIFQGQAAYAAMLNQLLANPGSITSDPGYQFQFSQGADAVGREMAAGGYLGSTNMGAALTQYGQGFAQNYFGQYEQMLAQLSGLTAPTSAGQMAGAANQSQSNAFWQNQQVFEDVVGMVSGMGGMGGSGGGMPSMAGGGGGGGMMGGGGGLDAGGGFAGGMDYPGGI